MVALPLQPLAYTAASPPLTRTWLLVPPAPILHGGPCPENIRRDGCSRFHGAHTGVPQEEEEFPSVLQMRTIVTESTPKENEA